MRKQPRPRPPVGVEMARALLKEGFCPWCEAGPFKVPVGHITRKHDLDRFQLRDELGFFYQDSLTDPTYHEERSMSARQRFLEGKTGIHPFKAGTTKTLSLAARQMQKEKSHLLSDDTRRRVAREYGDRRLEDARPRDDRIIELASEGLTNVQIASETGVHVRTIWAVLRRNGQPVGAARYHASQKGVLSQSLAQGIETQKARKAADAAELIAAFDRGVTIADLARQRGIARSAIRARLKKYGVNVPDGRADPNRQRGVRPKKLPSPCTVADCPGNRVAKGLCSKHYQQVRVGRTVPETSISADTQNPQSVVI